MKNIETINCGTVTKKVVNSVVQLCGWIHRRRDHGGVIFFDLRDESGLVQVVFNPEEKDIFSFGLFSLLAS